MKFRAAIFDLDGTLADTLLDIATTMNLALAELDLPPHPPEAYKGFVGAGIAVAAERALSADQLHLRDDVVARFRRLYPDHWVNTSAPYEGMIELLDTLLTRGIALGVLSNKPHLPTKAVVRHLFGDRFRLVYGQRPEAPKKPDPTVALEMAGLFDVDPTECVFIGDTLIDMETARSAGMYGVGVLWGFRPREELVEHGARALLAHPRDLLDLLDYGIESRVCLDPI